MHQAGRARARQRALAHAGALAHVTYKVTSFGFFTFVSNLLVEKVISKLIVLLQINIQPILRYAPEVYGINGSVRALEKNSVNLIMCLRDCRLFNLVGGASE